MVSKRVVTALFFAHLMAAVAFAQSAPQTPATSPEEFGHVSGGELNVITKRPSTLSGSIGLMSSTSAFGSNRKGLEATVGGTAVKDRVWFFAAAQQSQGTIASRFANSFPQSAASRRIDTNLAAQLSDRQSLAASFTAGRDNGAVTPLATMNPMSSSFLSLHYTGVVSSNMFFTANVTRSNTSQPPSPFATVNQP
jgi:hypothetical protein